MLVSSILDPAIFCPDLFIKENDKNGHYEAIVFRLMAEVSFCHLRIVDEKGFMIKETLDHLHSDVHKSNALLKLYDCTLKQNRLVRLPSVHWTDPFAIASDGSCAAVGLCGHHGIDVAIMHNDTLETMKLSGKDKPKCFALCTYHRSDASKKAEMSRGGQAVGGMNRQEFFGLMLDPVLRWASNCTLIDRYVAKAAQAEQDNWDAFKNTIGSICRTFRAGPGFNTEKKAEFVVVSGTEEPRGPAADAEARTLLDRLGLAGYGRVRVKLVAMRDLKEIHDRFLCTNQCSVGITRGFDVFAGGEAEEADVYIHQPRLARDGRCDPVEKVVNCKGLGEANGCESKQ